MPSTSIAAEPIIQSILPEKDVDGLHVVNAGKVATGDLEGGLISCTPAGAMVLVRGIRGDDLSGLNAVVIGRSNLFGKPMAALLLNANATVTSAHSRTRDLAATCRNADILVAAVGRPQMVKADWVKPGATVIDAVEVNRPEHIDDIADLHIWTADSVRADRLDFRPRHRLTVLVVQARPLLEPQRLPRRPEYGGCTSWVQLPIPETRCGASVYTVNELTAVARRVRDSVG